MSSYPLENTITNFDFSWSLRERITVIDNGASLARQSNFGDLMASDAFSVIVLDPASHLHKHKHLQDWDELQIAPYAVLGDGKMAPLYACMDPNMSGTLKPLDAAQLPQHKQSRAEILTTLSVPTMNLDELDGVSAVDWLILDDLNAPMAVLDNATETMTHTLLVHVRVALLPTHQQQANLATVTEWMSAHGFQLYTFKQPTYHSHLPNNIELNKQPATQLAAIDGVFTPDEERLSALSSTALTKLAFLMDTVHEAHDYAHALLARVDAANAQNYLVARSYLSPYDEEPSVFILTSDYSPAPWLAAEAG